MSRPRLTWIGAGLALAVLVLTIFPWPIPHPETEIDGFVPELITVNPKGFLERPGRVAVSRREVELSTERRSQPTVHVLTAEVPFTARFSVTVLGAPHRDVFPFQMKVWNPTNEVALEAWYSSDGTISAGLRTQTIWQQERTLLSYAVGGTEVWQVTRDERHVRLEVSGPKGRAAFDVDREAFPDLLRQPSLSLTLYATATGAGGSRVVIRDPLFSVPRQTRYGTTVQARWYRPAILLAVCGVVLWLGALVLSRTGPLTRHLPTRPKIRIGYAVVVIAAAAAGTLMAGWWLSRAPGHPYDMRSAKVWSETARRHGLAAIVQHPLIATERDAHGGQPYAAVNYPYPPVLSYLFWLIGKVASDRSTEQALKMVVMGIVVLGGVGIFAVSRRLGVSPLVAAVAAGGYMLNPAVLFDSAVWGQTDAVVALFLLMAASGIALKSAPLLWIGTTLAVLTKQTGGLFVLILLILGGASLGSRQMIRGLPAGLLGVFLVLTPAFLAGLHPSSLYRPLITKVLESATVGGQEGATGLVSQGAFNLWAAVATSEGAQGWGRLAFPDMVATRFGVSYFTLSLLLFALLVLVLLALILRKKPLTPGVVFLSLAVYGVGAAVFLTRMQARYLYFGVMFTALSLPWMPRKVGPAVLIVLTGTMIAAMWGVLVFTSIWHPGGLPPFEPERSWFNQAAAVSLGTDLGITIGGLLNVAAVIVLLWALTKAVHQRAPEPEGHADSTL